MEKTMRKWSIRIVVVAMSLLVGTFGGVEFTRADSPGPFGLGIIIGDPTGLSGNYRLSQQRSIDAAVAWSFGHLRFIRITFGIGRICFGLNGWPLIGTTALEHDLSMSKIETSPNALTLVPGFRSVFQRISIKVHSSFLAKSL